MPFNPTTDNIWQAVVNCSHHLIGPGQAMNCHLSVKNLTDRVIAFTSAAVEVPWGNRFPDPSMIAKMIPAGETQYVASFCVTMPEGTPGWREFGFHLDTWVYDEAVKSPVNFGVLRTSGNPLRVWLSPSPRYRVFLSKSNHPADYLVINTAKEILNAYGFDCFTLGDNVQVSNETLIPMLQKEINKADATIAIASPRDQSLITGRPTALQWFYDEVTTSNNLARPIIILHDESIQLVGLAEALACPKVAFAPTQLDQMISALNIWLPNLRDYLLESKQRAHNQWLAETYQNAYRQGLIAGQSRHGAPAQ